MRRKLSKIAFTFSGISLLGATLVGLSLHGDRRRLATVASEVTAGKGMIESLLQLNEFVYNNHGIAKNKGYFLFPSLGPTPVQVLEAGGNCTDKSRLLSALLREIGVSSTLVMLYPCENCPSTHTIVEVREKGMEMVLDPLYNLSFPDGQGGFFGLRELSSDEAILRNRIQELRAERDFADRINFYDTKKTIYTYARTINWRKNEFTRAVIPLLQIFWHEPLRMSRPQFTEDPKLSLALLLLAFSPFFLATGLLMRPLPSG